jgi:hypothetical protein
MLVLGLMARRPPIVDMARGSPWHLLRTCLACSAMSSSKVYSVVLKTYKTIETQIYKRVPVKIKCMSDQLTRHIDGSFRKGPSPLKEGIFSSSSFGRDGHIF